MVKNPLPGVLQDDLKESAFVHPALCGNQVRKCPRPPPATGGTKVRKCPRPHWAPSGLGVVQSSTLGALKVRSSAFVHPHNRRN